MARALSAPLERCVTPFTLLSQGPFGLEGTTKFESSTGPHTQDPSSQYPPAEACGVETDAEALQIWWELFHHRSDALESASTLP